MAYATLGGVAFVAALVVQLRAVAIAQNVAPAAGRRRVVHAASFGAAVAIAVGIELSSDFFWPDLAMAVYAAGSLLVLLALAFVLRLSTHAVAASMLGYAAALALIVFLPWSVTERFVRDAVKLSPGMSVAEVEAIMVAHAQTAGPSPWDRTKPASESITYFVPRSIQGRSDLWCSVSWQGGCADVIQLSTD